MEGKSKGEVASAAHSNHVAGAAQYLQNLPSRGLFSTTVLSTNVCPLSMGLESIVAKAVSGTICLVVQDRAAKHWLRASKLILVLFGIEAGRCLELLCAALGHNVLPEGGLRVYNCVHDTSPPEDQVVKTNTTNILIRSLTLKKLKNDCSSRDVKGKATSESATGKRLAERTADSRSSVKKANTTSGSRREGSHHLLSEKEVQSLTVERLRTFLKERGLPTKGKKDELVSRLINNREDSEDCSL